MRISTTRTESFSDAVIAISITLLVLDLVQGTRSSASAASLLEDWPAYVALLASFFTIASIWLSHHVIFSMLAHADAPVLLLNLAILLGVSLVPWPTSVLAGALRATDADARFAAILLYGIVLAVIRVPWVVLCLYAASHADLLQDEASARRLRTSAVGAIVGIGVAAIAVGIGRFAPLLALVIFLAAPAVLAAITVQSTRLAR